MKVEIKTENSYQAIFYLIQFSNRTFLKKIVIEPALTTVGCQLQEEASIASESQG